MTCQSLTQACSRKYELKRLGYDLERLERRVTEIYGIDKE